MYSHRGIRCNRNAFIITIWFQRRVGLNGTETSVPHGDHTILELERVVRRCHTDKREMLCQWRTSYNVLREEVKPKPLITDCTCQSKQVTDEEEDLLNSRKTRGAQKWTVSALQSLISSLPLNDPNSVSQPERPNNFILVGRFYACLTIILEGNNLITPDLNSTTDTDRSERFRILRSKTTRYLQSFIPMAIRTHNQQAGR